MKVVRLALAAGAALVLMGHSPYRQWVVYRETHLVVAADDGAPGAFAAADAVARVLAVEMARSGAVAARARSAVDCLKLLRSGQLPLALLLAGDAVRARGAFAREPPLALRSVAALGPYLLVAPEEFPEPTAREIARALGEHPPEGAPPVRAEVGWVAEPGAAPAAAPPAAGG